MASSSGGPRKRWKSCKADWQRKVVNNAVNQVAHLLQEDEDVEDFLQSFLRRLQQTDPSKEAVCARLQGNADSSRLLRSLGALRQEQPSKVLHIPSISVNDLDDAIVHSGLHASRNSLVAQGYHLSQSHYSKILRKESALRAGPAASKGGRPSKVSAEKCRILVQNALAPHLQESERVVVVGRGTKRKMVVASHLTKKRYRLWSDDASLHKEMAFNTFHKILRIHFPHVRNPHRNTDVCYHCKSFEKVLLPDALKCASRAQVALQSVAPTYFANFKTETGQQDHVAYLQAFQSYIRAAERNAQKDPARASLSRASRLQLHTTEASALSSLKPHLEIVEAYAWHQISARRQATFVGNLREGGLPRNMALIQVDFKENVKYPLSPHETSEEWHAQNKLSLTVFGANALVPSPPGRSLLQLSRICRNTETSLTLCRCSSASPKDILYRAQGVLLSALLGDPRP